MEISDLSPIFAPETSRAVIPEWNMKQNRNNQITKVSLVGIGANALIATFKVIIGLLSNSVAVLLDAINNVSDAMSSAITIIGVKLAGRKPDSKHPFGYGRVEYFSAILVAGIIFAAGASSLTESIKAIIHPEPTSFTWVSVTVILVAIVGKLILGRYFALRGKEEIAFDIVVSFDHDAPAICHQLKQQIMTKYPGKIVLINADTKFSE